MHVHNIYAEADKNEQPKMAIRKKNNLNAHTRDVPYNNNEIDVIVIIQKCHRHFFGLFERQWVRKFKMKCHQRNEGRDREKKTQKKIR